MRGCRLAAIPGVSKALREISRGFESLHLRQLKENEMVQRSWDEVMQDIAIQVSPELFEELMDAFECEIAEAMDGSEELLNER